MSRARGEKDYLGVLQGLNTEANALAFPEGFSSDEQNFLLAKDGTVRVRRRGFSNDLDSTSYVADDILQAKSYYWEAADLILVAIATVNDELVLRIHRNDDTPFDSFTYVDEYVINPSFLGSGFNVSFSRILNAVSVVCSSTNGDPEPPVLIEYNRDSNDLSVYTVDLYFRDFELIDDGLDLTQRPNVLTDEHTYNLYNAGWREVRRSKATPANFVPPLSDFTEETVNWDQPILSFEAPNIINFEYQTSQKLKVGWELTISTSTSNDGTYVIEDVINQKGGNIDYVITEEDTIVDEATANLGSASISYTEFPSNADIVYYGLSTNSDGEEVFSKETMFEISVGSTEAPRGHYVYSVFGDLDREDVLFYPDDVNVPTTTLTLQDTITL